MIDQTALARFRTALEASAAAPWAALETLARETVGVKLFTITVVDEAAGVARRLYTNMPDAYPASGTKPLRHDEWHQHVIVGRQPYVMNTLDEISRRFPDWELIGSLGCGSCLNMPIAAGGRLLGTVNMLDAEHHFDAERLKLAEGLRVPAMAAFLLAERGKGSLIE